ncbi:MAG: squalene/phytoene synthase family protein [Chloroflexota bacterium]|jgi:phytoene/squalene synthetase
MEIQSLPSGLLAAKITKSASKQTYYTIRLFADRERVEDAYRAYGYFRWVDDRIDESSASPAAKIAFAKRQQSLLNACYRGEPPAAVCAEEKMLVDLVNHDTEKNSGLSLYLHNMMDILVFDAARQGKVISQEELCEYSRKLAVAVTEAIYHFIGHDDPSPHHEARYSAVTAAHITHMLRDAIEDADNGYFNIPREYLHSHGIAPQDVTSPAYREWVRGRVQTAREYFRLGRECTAQVRNRRCRLAGYAYTARFEWILSIIERDHYCLRSEYPERKSLAAALWMAWSSLDALV